LSTVDEAASGTITLDPLKGVAAQRVNGTARVLSFTRILSPVRVNDP